MPGNKDLVFRDLLLLFRKPEKRHIFAQDRISSMPDQDLYHERPSLLERSLPTLGKILVWGGVFAVIYLLRSMFLFIFLTFVFSFLLYRSEIRLEKRIPYRHTRVVLVSMVLLGIIVAIGIFVIPGLKVQTLSFARNFPDYITRLDQELNLLGERYPMVQAMLPDPQLSTPAAPPPANGTIATPTPPPNANPSRVTTLLQQISGFGGGAKGDAKLNLLDLVRGVGGKVAAIASAFLLSLLFSFLIVLDFPKLAASVKSLEDSRLSYVYREVADSFRDFAVVLGTALEAQFVIAIVNTILTSIGLLMLGLGQSLAFLSVIVFFCSFIPVLGVFISSVPICLLALQNSGPVTMILAILMIILVHLIEAYILNPRIYGSYMRLNPVIVLVILTIGAKLFNVWGLLLGVPICTYIFGHVIKRPESAQEILEDAKDTPDTHPEAA